MKHNIQVMIDTREQQPFTFEKFDSVSCYREKLDYGDYTVVGHDMPADDYSIVIERKKSCKEYLRNLVANWDRFTRELEGLREYHTKVIIVEEQPCFERLYRKGYTQCAPNFLWSRITDVLIEYGVPTLFVNNQAEAELQAYRMMYKSFDYRYKMDQL